VIASFLLESIEFCRKSCSFIYNLLWVGTWAVRLANRPAQRCNGCNCTARPSQITLTVGFHRRFGSLQIYFEATPSVDHTYTIKSTLPFLVFRPRLPITRALFMTPEHTIDPPMPRLLVIHRACCLILYMSGAGEYIDKVFRDREAPAEFW
jgi:hypothetical protein